MADREVERLAMERVMQFEREQGFMPRDAREKLREIQKRPKSEDWNHIDTVDTTSSGFMTQREIENFARIFEQTGGRIIVVPKSK